MTLVALWFTGLSGLGFALMGFDKHAARNDAWRIPERTLLFWAFLGGAIGAKLAQRSFRHKTRKEPFRTMLNIALACNAVLAILLLTPGLRQDLFDILYTFL